MSGLVAQRFVKMGPYGTKLPLFLDCVDSNGVVIPCLVKTANWSETTTEKHLAAELASATLARGLGLDVAPHHMIAIDYPYLGTINQGLQAAGVAGQLAPGWAVGAEICDFKPYATDFPLGQPQLNDASILYAFDLASEHYDRHKENPNCGYRGKRIFIYDFDQCFPNLVEGQAVSRQYERETPNWMFGHSFEATLKRRKLQSGAVRNAFRAWSPNWLANNLPWSPPGWSGTIEAIWEEAQLIGQNVETLIETAENML